MNATAEKLVEMDMDDVLAFIRKTLAYPDVVINSAQKNIDLRNEHYRFDMSGEDGKVRGSNTIQNQTILNKFAYLGIYDYTKFITVDFYKGNGTIYYCYFNEDEVKTVDMGGYGTCEIIYEIFGLTIFSNKTKRRR